MPLRRFSSTDSSAEPERQGRHMMVLGWGLAFLVVWFFFSSVLQERKNPNTVRVLAGQEGELVLKRNVNGHYMAEGKINDVNVLLLLDTGATKVALPGHLEQDLNLDRLGHHKVSTASGYADAYSTRLETVTIGPLQLRDVSAVLIPDMPGNSVLLGMSALRNLDFVQKGEELILRPRNLE